jgi:hypothetical protein
MAERSLNTELSSLISSYYPVFDAEYSTYIELNNTHNRGGLVLYDVDDTIVAMTNRWVCQIVDDLDSEESLYELAMAAHAWVADFGDVIQHLIPKRTLFIDCIPTNTSYKPTLFTIPKTSWFK